MVLAAKNAKSAKNPWPMVRLGDVCEEVRERIPSNEIQLAQYVTTDNMIKGCGGIKEAESLPVGVGLVHYHSGDVLVSNIRPYLKKTWLADRSGGCSSDVIVFRSNREDLASGYLYRVLSQDGFFDYSMQNVSGTKMPRGKRDWIKQFQFPLPPRSVQREIVARLEKELGETDRVAAKFKAIAENADAEFKAELDETFKELEDGDDVLSQRRVTAAQAGLAICSEPSRAKRVPKGAENAENISRVEQHVERVDGRAGRPLPAVEGELSRAKFAKSAKVQRVRLGDVCEIRAGATHHGIAAENGPYPVYGSGGYICRATQWRCPANTVTIGRKGTLGKPLLIEEPFWNIDTCFGVTPNERLDAKYLWRFCQGFDFYQLIPASGRPSTNSDAIKKITIPLPPLSVQFEIASRLDAAKEKCEKLKAAAERGLREAENLRKAILAEAFL